MVSVARALAQNGRILLLDEPAASLDLKHRAQLSTALRRLREERGLTALVVTHDLQMLDASFDRRLGRLRALTAEMTASRKGRCFIVGAWPGLPLTASMGPTTMHALPGAAA